MQKNKKAAMELSIGTMVTIVLLVSVLILGLVLVRNIFTTSTESVDDINDKVKNEINNLFVDNNDKVLVRLGSNKKAKISQGTQDFGIAIGAKTYDGSSTDRGRLRYKISLDTQTNQNCIDKMGERRVRELITTPLEEWINFDQFQGSQAYARVAFTIPDGTVTCTQKFFVDVRDTEQTGQESLGGTYFVIEIEEKSFF